MGKVYTRTFSDQNGTKTLPDGAAHTYMAYIRKYLPPPPGYLARVHGETRHGHFEEKEKLKFVLSQMSCYYSSIYLSFEIPQLCHEIQPN